MVYYVIITMIIGFVWLSINYKEFTYPIITIILGTFLAPIIIPLKLILKALV